jgi:hypothetical protein
MTGRIATFVLAAVIAAYGFGGTAVAVDDSREDVVFVREEDGNGVLITETGDDDDGDDTDGNSRTSGVDSNDATNSRITGVSGDDDRSVGDLTRDRTKDGAGTPTRDRTANHTNDRSRNDTR